MPWWLWLLLFTAILTACIVLPILISFIAEIINARVVARIHHKKIVEIFGKNEFLKKLTIEAEKEKIFLRFENDEKYWYAIESFGSKIIKIPKTGVVSFSEGKVDAIDMALLLAHEIGHFKSPFRSADYCSYYKKDWSCLEDELKAHKNGFEIMEKNEICGWKNKWVWMHILIILQIQCKDCFSIILGPQPNLCGKVTEVKKIYKELDEIFEKANEE